MATTAAHRRKSATNSSDGGVSAWEDDPLSGLPPIARPQPKILGSPLGLKISGPAPPAGTYPKGTPNFRYWTAADALARVVAFWVQVLPAKTTWEPGAPLAVLLDEGDDLNAYYDRKALNFFHHQSGSTTVYSGESPDVVCHECGHAILDAIKPQLFDVASSEVAAFHESFADISAILSAIQLPTVRAAVLGETGPNLYRSSRLSRLAEQLGWAIRQIRPELVDPDCLRNAVNAFFYRDPQTLPPSAPAVQLSSEPHSFSRVFTGAFYEALAGMLAVEAGDQAPTPDQFEQVSIEAGQLLIDAITGAPVVPEFMSQVAGHVIQAETQRYKGKYASALKSAFLRHGVLSLDAMNTLAAAPMAFAVGVSGPVGQEVPTQISLATGRYGLTVSLCRRALGSRTGSSGFRRPSFRAGSNRRRRTCS